MKDNCSLRLVYPDIDEYNSTHLINVVPVRTLSLHGLLSGVYPYILYPRGDKPHMEQRAITEQSAQDTKLLVHIASPII